MRLVSTITPFLAVCAKHPRLALFDLAEVRISLASLQVVLDLLVNSPNLVSFHCCMLDREVRAARKQWSTRKPRFLSSFVVVLTAFCNIFDRPDLVND